MKELRVSPEQVQSYAERLAKDNFFNYQPQPDFIFDGLVETMTLNYQGKSRTINSGNQTRRTLFKDVVRELEALLQ